MKNKGLLGLLAIITLALVYSKKEKSSPDSEGTSDVGNDSNDEMENSNASTPKTTPIVEASDDLNVDVQEFRY
jgi:hypothetical protein